MIGFGSQAGPDQPSLLREAQFPYVLDCILVRPLTLVKHLENLGVGRDLRLFTSPLSTLC